MPASLGPKRASETYTPIENACGSPSVRCLPITQNQRIRPFNRGALIYTIMKEARNAWQWK